MNQQDMLITILTLSKLLSQADNANQQKAKHAIFCSYCAKTLTDPRPPIDEVPMTEAELELVRKHHKTCEKHPTRGQVEELEQKCKRLEGFLEEAKKENAKRQKEANVLAGQLVEIESERRKLVAENGELKTELQASIMHQTNLRLRNQMAYLSSQLTDSESERKQLAARVAELEKKS